MKRVIFTILVLVLLAIPLMTTSGCSQGEQVTYLNMGSTSSTSGLYVWCVAGARAMNKGNTDINVTVVETGGALDNLRRMKDGTFDIAFCVDVPSAMQMYKGIDTFANNSWEPLRFLLFRNGVSDRIYVRADSGIKTFADLAGKKFNAGLPGSSSADYFMKAADACGIKIDFIPAAASDAIQALKEKNIAGMQKSSPIDGFDSAMLEAHLTTPLTVIGYTQQDVAKIRAKYPYMSYLEAPAGSIQGLPQLGAVLEEVPLVGAVTSSRVPENVIYKVVKAYNEGFDSIAQAYPAVKGWDPIKDYFKRVPAGAEIPAHSGLIRYARELGVNVESRFIPPEYK